MAEKHKQQPEDLDSSFDFLNDREEVSPQERQKSAGSRENATSAFPIIRKPVPVEQSGPLKAPSPGDPVEPPPPITDGIRQAADSVDGHYARDTSGGEQAEYADQTDADELDFLNDINVELSKTVRLNNHTKPASFTNSSQNVPQSRGLFFKRAGLICCSILMVCGFALLGYDFAKKQGLPVPDLPFGLLPGNAPTAEPESTTITKSLDSADNADELQGRADAGGTAVALPEGSSLNVRFRNQLDRLDVLIEAGSLDEAEQLLRTMDRTVYGYGAPEFAEIEADIKIRRDSGTLPSTSDVDAGATEEPAQLLAEQRAEEQRLAEQRAEEQRLAEQRAEEQRAEEQRRAEIRAEEQRLVEIRAELRAEEQRLAELRAEERRLGEQRAEERAEEQRLIERREAQTQEQDRATQRAAAEDAQRLADEAATSRLAAQQTGIASAESNESANADEGRDRTAAADANLSVEELAAIQRAEARRQRLASADSQLSQRRSESSATRPATRLDSNNEEAVASLALPISDNDMQIVYKRFRDLQLAIQNQDIEKVATLTDQSSVRIQQFLQIFENNELIETRLGNIRLLRSLGEIRATLQIIRLERADGTVTGPPLDLAEVPLSSARKGKGWSAIRW